ncbi:hypothetical protein EVA_09948 [gut metagenome]|uniref:Uncharacterized protein n=1 Tax=gut metagenome TaxID=749906 RepID=J9GIX2_9ZZZZ
MRILPPSRLTVSGMSSPKSTNSSFRFSEPSISRVPTALTCRTGLSLFLTLIRTPSKPTTTVSRGNAARITATGWTTTA